MSSGPRPRPRPKANVIDAYLARQPAAARKALTRLRRLIRAAAPKAEETISYQLPAFCLDGRLLVCFGAAARHLAFYPGSGTAVAAHKKELAGFSTSKGAVRFQADEPLPAALVRKLIKYRIAENAARIRG